MNERGNMEFTLNTIKEWYDNIMIAIRHWQFGNKAQLAFLEDLYLLINDGIPANRAVDMMAQVSTGLSQEVALNLSHKIAQGQPLAEGMNEWFSTNVVEIIRVGEAGGALAQTMKSAINMLSQRGVAIGAFVSALAYPTTVIVIASFVMIYLNSSVFDQFRQIKPESEWPVAGQRLVAIASFIQEWWWIVLLAFAAIIFFFLRLMTNYVGEYRAMLDRFPPFNFYRRLTAGRLLETLGLLVANGVVFKSAIKVMQYQATPYMHSHLVMMEHLLSMGKTNIAEVLETGLVSEKDLMRLRVMAEVKGFEHGLIRMGIRGTEEATSTMRLIARISGGILLTVGAILILVIVQGIYLTGMSMSS